MIYVVRQESHRVGLENHEADGGTQMVDTESGPDLGVPEEADHLHLVHIPERVEDKGKARWMVYGGQRKGTELRVYGQPLQMLAHVRRGLEVPEVRRYLDQQVRLDCNSQILCD